MMRFITTNFEILKNVKNSKVDFLKKLKMAFERVVSTKDKYRGNIRAMKIY